jgi:hypothetical protein
LLVEPGHALLHRHRGPECPVGIVGVRDRRSPQGHNGVTHELVQRSTVLEDDLHHLAEILGQQPGDGVRSHRLRHCREAPDIAEQDCDRPTLPTQGNDGVLLGNFGCDVGCEIPLEIGANQCLTANLLGIAAVPDANGH